MASQSHETPSCYLLYVELDATGGGNRRETFAYAATAHVMSALRQELEGALLGRLEDAIDAIAVRAQVMTIAVVARGTIVDAIDVRRFVSARTADGELVPVDELDAEWKEGSTRPMASREGGEVALMGLELDELGLLSALPPLEPPLLRHGQALPALTPKEKRAELVELARTLGRGVTYGYSDAAGVWLSRERFEDPDPPSPDDIDAYFVQHPSSAVAVSVAKGIAARGDRDAAARWVRKADREGLPVAAIEAVLREAFDVEASAPPLRPARRRVELETQVLANDPRWLPIAKELEDVSTRGTAEVEEGLRLFCHETTDHGAAVVAFMLRRQLARGRGPAYSALMLKQAMQRSEETVLPGVVAAADAAYDELDRALPLVRESARRLIASEGALSAVDAALLGLLPTTFDAARFDRATRVLADLEDFQGAALVAAIADRVVSDPSDVCAIASERARLLLRARKPAEARAIADEALRYWEAHAWMRSPEPSADCRFWRAAALAALGDSSELDGIRARSDHYRALAERERVLEAAPEREPVVEEEPGGLRAGHRVAHAKFGEGIVERVEGAGETAKIAVRFASGEAKVLLARFLRPLE